MVCSHYCYIVAVIKTHPFTILLLALWIKTNLLNMTYGASSSGFTLSPSHLFSPLTTLVPSALASKAAAILSTVLLPFSVYLHRLVLCAWVVFFPLLTKNSCLCNIKSLFAYSVNNPFPFWGLKPHACIWLSSSFLIHIGLVILLPVCLSALTCGLRGQETGVAW